MVLAAGRGERLRPLTDTRPKPLIEVVGRTLLDRALDRLADGGIALAVVNAHHLGGMIEAHAKTRQNPEIVVSPEADLLDTGGGVRQALRYLGSGPFFVVNGDVVWLDGRRRALDRLAEGWDDGRMDALLLVHATVRAFGYRGAGDFVLDGAGGVRRRREREVAPFVFTGVELLHPRLFDGAPKDGPFSLNLLFDRAIAARRLFALVHDGEWFHVGTPDALAEAETALGASGGGRLDRFF